MGRNDLCREGSSSVGSQASLCGLSSWTNASLLSLAFGDQCSKHRPPKGNTRRWVRVPQQSRGTRHPLSHPRKPRLEEHRGLLRGRHRRFFRRRNLGLVQVIETQSGSHVLRLHRCLKTTPKFQNSTGMVPRSDTPQKEKELGVLCLFLFIGTDAWVFVRLCRPVVRQVQEKVFSSDAFRDLDLHPHLVSISQCFVRLTLLTCLFI